MKKSRIFGFSMLLNMLPEIFKSAVYNNCIYLFLHAWQTIDQQPLMKSISIENAVQFIFEKRT